MRVIPSGCVAGRPTPRDPASVLDFARLLLIGLVLAARLLRGSTTILLVWVGNVSSLSDWPFNHPPLGSPVGATHALLNYTHFNKMCVAFRNVLTACPYHFSR